MSQRTRTATRTHGFTESVIRTMTRVAHETGALNLSQGFPDFPAPQALKDAACAAIQADVNQYAVTWGAPRLRRAVAEHYQRMYGASVDEGTEVTVTCGATEAVAAAVLALLDPGDELLVFEPFYENYAPDAVLAGAKPVLVPLEAPEFHLDPDRLRAAVTDRTRALILNSPNNPTGRVLTPEEAHAVADVAIERDLIVITDEIYEHIVYEGRHLPLMTLDGMRDRTVTVSGLSKTFAVTGWRLGTIVAPPDLTAAIRKVHDFLTVGAAAPLQDAGAAALESFPASYYTDLAREYGERRDVLCEALEAAGYSFVRPSGAYYVLADFSALSDLDDTRFSLHLAEEAGVVPVPGSSFFAAGSSAGRSRVRFAFCKRIETLQEAGERLRRYASAGA